MVFASFVDVEGVARHILHLLQTQGETALDAVRAGVAVIKAATGRDLFGVLAALDKVRADVTEIVAAVKAEFGIE